MIEIWLDGRGVGKARPRFSRGTVYTNSRYADWKDNAILQIESLNLPPAPVPAIIECYFVNFLSSDSDNLIGAVLDSLVEAGVLQNDSSSFVAGCSGRFAKTKKCRGQDKPIGTLIRIFPAQIEYLEMHALMHCTTMRTASKGLII